MPTYAQYLSGGLGQPRRESIAPQFPGSSLGLGGRFGAQLGPSPGGGNRAEFDRIWQPTGAVGDTGPGSFMRNRLLLDWINAGPSAWGQVPPGLEQFFRRRGAPSAPISSGSTAYSAAGSPYGVGMFSQPGVGSFLNEFNTQLQQPQRFPGFTVHRPSNGMAATPAQLDAYKKATGRNPPAAQPLQQPYRIALRSPRSPYGF